MGNLRVFGELVREARTRMGLSAYELAARIDRQPSFVSRLENGQNAYPPEPALLLSLTKVLGLSRKQMLIAMGYLDDDAADQAREESTKLGLASNDPRQPIVSFLLALDPIKDDDILEAFQGVVRLAARRRPISIMGRKR